MNKIDQLTLLKFVNKNSRVGTDKLDLQFTEKLWKLLVKKGMVK